jgi:hypothetical protein
MTHKRSEGAAPRLVPDRPLPPYAYVSGRFPHPVSDPAGHSYGKPAEPPPAPDPERWQECWTYLYGLDLFNHGYFWEAHEAWEGLWHACGRKGPLADFFKGLIQLAAAGVKQRAGIPAGVEGHATRAAQLWRGVAASAEGGAGELFGLRLDELIGLAERVARERWPEAPAPLVPTR